MSSHTPTLMNLHPFFARLHQTCKCLAMLPRCVLWAGSLTKWFPRLLNNPITNDVGWPLVTWTSHLDCCAVLIYTTPVLTLNPPPLRRYPLGGWTLIAFWPDLAVSLNALIVHKPQGSYSPTAYAWILPSLLLADAFAAHPIGSWLLDTIGADSNICKPYTKFVRNPPPRTFHPNGTRTWA